MSVLEQAANGMEHKECLSLAEVCACLSVSQATGSNWVRLGKLVPDIYAGANNPLFYESTVEELLRGIQSGELEALRQRRNKTQVTGAGLYREYLERSGSNGAVVEGLLEWEALPSREQALRLILAEYAVQLLVQAQGMALNCQTGLLERFLCGDVKLGQHAGLVRDLAGEEIDPLAVRELRYALKQRADHITGQDFLGFAYLSLQNRGKRKAQGAYYTPARVVRRMVRHLPPDRLGGLVVDPCCGTGNFLLRLAAKTGTPANLCGQDIDPIAVAIARINLALAFPKADVGWFYRNITCGDSLLGSLPGEAEMMIGNPPWGSRFTREEHDRLRGRYRTAARKGINSCDLFLEMALERLRPGGLLSFVLPQSLLDVGSHREAREVLLEKARICRVEYLGNVFDGVLCPSVALTLERRQGSFTTRGIQVEQKGRRFTIQEERGPTDSGFHLNMTDREYRCLEKIANCPSSRTLSGGADFALGIVTGDNKQYLRQQPFPGSEPVLKGSDIVKYGILPPKQHLRFDPAKFQQVAPESLYRAREKLLYRFVGKTLVFAYDDRQILSLNSCNILIPRIPGLEMKYILAVLNSRVAQFFWSQTFSSVKLLRSHIEKIPIPAASRVVQGEMVAQVDGILGLEHNSGRRRVLYERLDRQVMELYGLSPAEQELVRNTLGTINLYL